MCQIPGCGKPTAKTITTTTQTVELCTDHLDPVTGQHTNCALCTAILRVGGTWVDNHESYDGETEIVTCPTCSRDPLPEHRCKVCTCLVRLGTTDVRPNTPYTRPAMRLCNDRCNSAPKRRCSTGCEQVLFVGTKEVHGSQPYSGGRIRVCNEAGDCYGRILTTERCRACLTPIAMRASVGGTTVVFSEALRSEVRKGEFIRRCSICARSLLRTRTQAAKAAEKALAFVQGWVTGQELPYPKYDKRLEWTVEDETRFTVVGELGHCDSQWPKEGKLESLTVDLPTHKIVILSQMSTLRFQTALVHELTHAYLNESRLNKQEYVEGLCNYVEHLFLKSITSPAPPEKTELDFLLETLERSTDPEYGVGYQHVKKHAGAKPIAWLKQQKQKK